MILCVSSLFIIVLDIFIEVFYFDCTNSFSFHPKMLVKPENPMATISRIVAKRPIVGADSIESVQVKGWNCVAKIGEFNVGDPCIYFTIGAVFPENYEKTVFLKNKPLKTKKILGVLSQGMVATMDWLTDFPLDKPLEEFVEGDDVTDHFNIKKYIELEEQDQYACARAGKYPEYVPKTDEGRIQNHIEMLDYIRGHNVVITRKEDGCSATYIHRNGEFVVCSRNLICNPNQPGFLHYAVPLTKFDLQTKMEKLGRNLAIQGELVGPKINANRLKLRDFDFRVFNIYDIDAFQYLTHDEVQVLCQELGVNTVPLLYKGKADDTDILASLDNLLDFASSVEYGPGIPAEGVVVKINEADYRRTSFKAISNKYLLKYNL